MERDADEMKNYLVTNVVPDGWNTAAKQKKGLFSAE